MICVEEYISNLSLHNNHPKASQLKTTNIYCLTDSTVQEFGLGLAGCVAVSHEITVKVWVRAGVSQSHDCWWRPRLFTAWTSHRATWVSQWHPHFPQSRRSQRDQGRSHNVFNDLISVVTHHHFTHILLITIQAFRVGESTQRAEYPETGIIGGHLGVWLPRRAWQ